MQIIFQYIEAKVLLKITVLVMKMFNEFAGHPKSGYVRSMVVESNVNWAVGVSNI